MFGLFHDKNAEIKKKAHARAINWWKGLTIRGMDEKSRPCYFCRGDVPKMDGYLFSSHHILENEKYMETEISRMERRGVPPEAAQQEVWNRIEQVYDDWMACEKCLKKFFID